MHARLSATLGVVALALLVTLNGAAAQEQKYISGYILLNGARNGRVLGLEGSKTLERAGLNVSNSGDFGYAQLEDSILKLRQAGVEVFLSMGGWNYNCYPYMYMRYSVGGYGPNTPNYWKINKFGSGSLDGCKSDTQYCYVCEPPSENTTLLSFSIFPEVNHSSVWQQAIQYVTSTTQNVTPEWHPELSPGSTFVDSKTGIAVYKYTAIAKTLMIHISNIKPDLKLSTAASAVGAWSTAWWGGNLKGVWYWAKQWFPDVIDFMSTGPNAGGINVMTYDLSDNPQFHECPQDNVCTLSQQVQFYMQTYSQAQIPAFVGYEVGTPACSVEDLRSILSHFDRRLEVDQRDGTGYGAIHYAASAGQAEALAVLLEFGGDVNLLNTQKGQTPLHCACNSCHLNVVKEILKHREVAPAIARLLVEAEIVSLLCQAGATIPDGMVAKNSPPPPILLAAHHGHAGAVQALLTAGAHPDATDLRGHRALHKAARAGHVPCVEVLLRGKANPNATDKNNNTPLTYASDMGHPGICSRLLRAGAQISIASTASQGNPLHAAARNKRNKVVQVLVQEASRDDLDINAADKNGYTALHLAALNGDVATSRVLVQHGADTTRRNKRGRTPSQEAQHAKHVQLANLLGDAARLLDEPVLGASTPTPAQLPRTSSQRLPQRRSVRHSASATQARP
ncbi:uncharacterized protein MONBRDRAFT_7785, partial [Monosiga brevicollis MX1]